MRIGFKLRSTLKYWHDESIEVQYGVNTNVFAGSNVLVAISKQGEIKASVRCWNDCISSKAGATGYKKPSGSDLRPKRRLKVSLMLSIRTFATVIFQQLASDVVVGSLFRCEMCPNPRPCARITHAMLPPDNRVFTQTLYSVVENALTRAVEANATERMTDNNHAEIYTLQRYCRSLTIANPLNAYQRRTSLFVCCDFRVFPHYPQIIIPYFRIEKHIFIFTIKV